jgi:hypothetical protein
MLSNIATSSAPLVLEAIPLATQKIRIPYFQLPIAQPRSTIKRERVYCYELYHQLRLLLKDSPLTLTGEPDKSGRADFPAINPDFIFHTPGHHHNNVAVMEVECHPNKSHLIKDFKNLRIMKDKKYSTLILLIFSVHQIPWQRLKDAAIEASINLNDIAIFLHQTEGKPATLESPPAI